MSDTPTPAFYEERIRHLEAERDKWKRSAMTVSRVKEKAEAMLSDALAERQQAQEERDEAIDPLGATAAVLRESVDRLSRERQQAIDALREWLEAEDADDAAVAELQHADQYGILRRNQERTRAEADAARERARAALVKLGEKP